MKTILCFLLLIAFFTAQRLDNYSLVRLRITDPQKLEQFSQLFGNADIWSNDGAIALGLDMDVMLSPQQYKQLVSIFLKDTTGVAEFRVLHKNVQEMLDQEKKVIKRIQAETLQKMTKVKSQAERDDVFLNEYFKNYHKWEEMHYFLKNLTAKYPTMTDYFIIGKTHEGRDIFGIKIHSPGQLDPAKKTIHFNSLIHAREWISGMVTQYAMLNLLEKYDTDADVKKILDNFNFYIIPALNADGYAYTWSNYRLWRKNRNPNSGRGYYGVDLNRNFKHGFGIGASSSESSDTYKGPHPVSEKESIALDNYFKEHSSSLVAGIDWHSYSQLILRSWGFNRTLSPDEPKMKEIGAKLADAIKSVHKESYSNIRGVELYPAGGGLDDHMYAEYKLVSFTVELRDKGRYGFVLPPAQILPTCEENWAAIKALGLRLLQ